MALHSNTDFLTELQAFKRKRIALSDLRSIFFRLRPEVQNNPERGHLLLAALRDMEQAGQVSFPAAASWDAAQVPALPLWIQLAPAQEAQPRQDYTSVPWMPELGFWPDLKAAQLETACLINGFLRRRKGTLRQIPIKERSLEIFGDEKRLDLLRTGDSLFGGRLPLSALGAFQVPLPLPYRAAPVQGKPLLVVENHNSYWSFGEWNQTALRYSAVVYGAGEAFRSSGRALEQVLAETKGMGVQYLGDLDPTGIRIPLDFNEAQIVLGVQLTPALEWYRWLIEHGIQRELPESAPSLKAIDWLGDELGTRLADLWRKKKWVPQEALGFEKLMDHVDFTRS